MPSRKKIVVCIIVSFKTMTIGYFLIYLSYKNNETISNRFRPDISELASLDKPLPVILEWTTFFSETNYVKLGLDCPYRNCIVTNNRTFLNDSSVIVFHFSDVRHSDLPSLRTEEQVWLIFALESPQSTASWSSFNGMFNWTATYRTDSDVWTPYGHVMKLKEQRLETRNYSQGKTKMIAWFNSNCNTKGGRELFVKELSKHIAVDIYGGCGDKSCLPKMSRECYESAASQYFFYLSFENSICKDYVTEKFFHILDYDFVPVVFGGANYSAIAPPGSYIDALSFESPKALADYLLAVSRNETMYNSFFTWRNTHTKGGYHWVCELCRRLTFRDAETKSFFDTKTYTDIERWWKHDAKCSSWQDIYST